MKTMLCYLIAIVCALPAGAEVYKVIDKDGRVTYTDDPPQNAPYEAVELKPINTQPPVEVQANPRPQAQPNRSDDAPLYALNIAAPADGTAVPPGQRDLQIEVQLEPALRGDHRIQFMLNGAPVGEPTTRYQTIIHEIFRGEHSVSAAVLDANGRVIATSPGVTVFVIRPTVR